MDARSVYLMELLVDSLTLEVGAALQEPVHIEVPGIYVY